MSRHRAALLAAVIALFGACAAPASSPTPTTTTYRVIATTSVFADLARLALGSAAQVESIVPAGIDVHTFEPSPSDAGKIAQADLILMNGLGLDEWVGSLIDAAQKSDRDVLRLGEGLDQSDGWIYLTTGGQGGAQGVDPHVWLDPNGAALYLHHIAERVIHDRPELTDVIRSSLTSGLARLRALDDEVRTLYEAIPAAHRAIVTFHDAFGYYARAYDITIVGVAVQSPGQDPSAREIAALIDAIRAAGVTTVFSEIQFPSKVLTSVAAETGATVLANLYSDALGDAPYDTYVAAMRANATAIAASLQR